MSSPQISKTQIESLKSVVSRFLKTPFAQKNPDILVRIENIFKKIDKLFESINNEALQTQKAVSLDVLTQKVVACIDDIVDEIRIEFAGIVGDVFAQIPEIRANLLEICRIQDANYCYEKASEACLQFGISTSEAEEEDINTPKNSERSTNTSVLSRMIKNAHEYLSRFMDSKIVEQLVSAERTVKEIFGNTGPLVYLLFYCIAYAGRNLPDDKSKAQFIDKVAVFVHSVISIQSLHYKHHSGEKNAHDFFDHFMHFIEFYLDMLRSLTEKGRVPPELWGFLAEILHNPILLNQEHEVSKNSPQNFYSLFRDKVTAEGLPGVREQDGISLHNTPYYLQHTAQLITRDVPRGILIPILLYLRELGSKREIEENKQVASFQATSENFPQKAQSDISSFLAQYPDIPHDIFLLYSILLRVIHPKSLVKNVKHLREFEAILDELHAITSINSHQKVALARSLHIITNNTDPCLDIPVKNSSGKFTTIREMLYELAQSHFSPEEILSGKLENLHTQRRSESVIHLGSSIVQRPVFANDGNNFNPAGLGPIDPYLQASRKAFLEMALYPEAMSLSQSLVLQYFGLSKEKIRVLFESSPHVLFYQVFTQVFAGVEKGNIVGSNHEYWNMVPDTLPNGNRLERRLADVYTDTETNRLKSAQELFEDMEKHIDNETRMILISPHTRWGECLMRTVQDNGKAFCNAFKAFIVKYPSICFVVDICQSIGKAPLQDLRTLFDEEIQNLVLLVSGNKALQAGKVGALIGSKKFLSNLNTEKYTIAIEPIVQLAFALRRLQSTMYAGEEDETLESSSQKYLDNLTHHALIQLLDIDGTIPGIKLDIISPCGEETCRIIEITITPEIALGALAQALSKYGVMREGNLIRISFHEKHTEKDIDKLVSLIKETLQEYAK